jgi:hypothetical protein
MQMCIAFTHVEGAACPTSQELGTSSPVLRFSYGKREL